MNFKKVILYDRGVAPQQAIPTYYQATNEPISPTVDTQTQQMEPQQQPNTKQFLPHYQLPRQPEVSAEQSDPEIKIDENFFKFIEDIVKRAMVMNKEKSIKQNKKTSSTQKPKKVNSDKKSVSKSKAQKKTSVKKSVTKRTGRKKNTDEILKGDKKLLNWIYR